LTRHIYFDIVDNERPEQAVKPFGGPPARTGQCEYMAGFSLLSKIYAMWRPKGRARNSMLDSED
jgi:hypothetical protein